MPNVIFRGPIDHQPRTLNLPLNGGHPPGVIVHSTGTNLARSDASDAERELFVLSNNEFAGQDIETDYTSGDTAIAYEMLPGLIFQGRLAAATYAKDDPLTVGASGRFTPAATGDLVIAHFSGTPGAKSAGHLDDVRIANAFRKA